MQGDAVLLHFILNYQKLVHEKNHIFLHQFVAPF